MTFDPERLLSMSPIVTHHRMSERDTMLYALGVGAHELEFIYEEKLQALPTMAAIMAYPGFIWSRPELGANWRKVLHGEQSIELHSSLPVAASLRGETRIEAIHDKGSDKGSLALVVRQVFDEDSGALIATVRMTMFLRGDGGRGGSPGSPPAPHRLPEGEPDFTVALQTLPSQAAIYRLSGDYNPLHIDPAVARQGGFDAPILHGLCTYAFAGRALLKTVCDNDPSRVRRLDTRLSAPVYPGETIVTEIWREDSGTASFRSSVAERGLVVLSNGFLELA